MMTSSPQPGPEPVGDSSDMHANAAALETDQPESGQFEKYFTLEEAASLVPQVRMAITEAHGELESAKDTVILFKRILLAQKKTGKEPNNEQLQHLKALYEKIEDVYAKWIQHFGEQGIVLRDLAEGLIDFPYYSRQSGEEFLLCWKHGEDGLFYFHPVDSGFSGRQPISLLPE